MAKQTIVSLLDDLDGKPADETVVFGLDGAEYEIDLTEKHAEELRKALAKYITKGRRRPAVRRTPAGLIRQARQPFRGPNAPKTSNNREIRAWAQANGHQVADRGAIPLEIREAYEKATGQPT